MAELTALIGSTHSPWYPRKTSVPEAERDEGGRSLADWASKVKAVTERAEPDAIVIVASDHFHQFFANNMPQWAIGRMDSYEGTFYNEKREFGIPEVTIPGNRQLSTDIIEAGFEHGFDFAYSDELRLDHACVVPSLMTQPQLDIPVVPILTNTGFVPMPPAKRFQQLGEVLTKGIEGTTSVDRIMVIASGNLSQEVGGPAQLLPQAIDAEFDELAVGWIKSRDFDTLTSELTFERMLRSGNGTFQFMNLITMAAMQGDLNIVMAQGSGGRGTSRPCFIYEP